MIGKPTRIPQTTHIDADSTAEDPVTAGKIDPEYRHKPNKIKAHSRLRVAKIKMISSRDIITLTSQPDNRVPCYAAD